MGFRVKTNTSSIAAQRALSNNNRDAEKSLSKLAAGSRIVSSADDAAGLAISNKLDGHIRSIKQSNRNANDGISMIQVAEGGLNEQASILVRLRELAIQASSDTVSDTERSFTDMEYQNLKLEMQRVAEVTEFNGIKLLDGQGEELDFQIGINNNQFQDRITYDRSAQNANIEFLGISELTVASKEGAQGSLEKIDNAITTMAKERASLGALQNRLMSTSNNLEIAEEGLTSANSRIKDLDYASETAVNARNNILNQAGTMVLAQANQSGSNALRLIG
jgi:flagellin